jgi:hypothetical protein
VGSAGAGRDVATVGERHEQLSSRNHERRHDFSPTQKVIGNMKGSPCKLHQLSLLVLPQLLIFTPCRLPTISLSSPSPSSALSSDAAAGRCLADPLFRKTKDMKKFSFRHTAARRAR